MTNNVEILILTQGIKKPEIMKKGLDLAKAYASTVGLNFIYTFKETAKQFHSYEFSNSAVGKAVAVDAYEILSETQGSYRIACLLFDATTISPQPTNPVQIPILKGNCNSIQIPEQWWNEFPETLADYFLHELCHAGFFFKGDIEHDMTHLLNNRTIDPIEYDKWAGRPPHEYYTYLLGQLKNHIAVQQTGAMPVLRIRSPYKKAVEQVQQILGIKVDGAFGPKTLEAVRAFQSSVGLVADGIIGPKTWEELAKKKPGIKPSGGLSLIEAIIQVESSGNLRAIGDLNLEYPAYGPMQIRQPVCIDVNKAFGTKYKAKDCLGNKELSIFIFNKYQSIYNKNGTDEEKARTWNGGPGWKLRPHLTDGYWNKVKALL